MLASGDVDYDATSTSIGTSASYATSITELDYNSDLQVYLETVGYGFCIISNLFGNTLTLIAMKRFSFLKDKKYTSLLMLTISDLLMTVYESLMIALRYDAFPSITMTEYRLLIGAMHVVIFGSMLQVVIVAADRFIAIIFPFFYNSRITRKSLMLCSSAAWLLAIIITIIYQFLFDDLMSGETWPFAVDIFLCGLVAVMLVVLHGKIALTARQQRNRITALELTAPSNSDANNRGVHKSKKKLDRATIMMLFMVGVYLMLWFPLLLSSILLIVTGRYTKLTYYIRAFGGFTVALNSSVNFIIYAVANRKFRTAYIYILTCRRSENDEFTLQSTINTFD